MLHVYIYFSDYRRGDVQRKLYPKLCSSDRECPENSKCLKKDSRGICIPSKMTFIVLRKYAVKLN